MSGVQSDNLEWMVIGAGPAGIATVGKLIDKGVPPEKIGWMDPYFQVGDLGKKWNAVSSNTKVDLFLRFLHDCKSFEYKSCPIKFPIDQMDPDETCLLQAIADPLEWVTFHLKGKVQSYKESALALNLIDRRWEIKTANGSIFATNVVLAIGSEAKNLSHAGKEIIPLDIALNSEKLTQTIKPEDRIAVFGSSHSAVLILANLIQLNTSQIVNFYRSPHQYAVDLDGWTLFDNTGLKGFAATWAQEHLDGKHPANLKRVLTSDHICEEELASCNKIIYAVGFERRKTPVLEQFKQLHYNDKTGIIAPGLFGVGIAFPQAQLDPLMNLEYRVGLWKFMDYLNTILPIWLKYASSARAARRLVA